MKVSLIDVDGRNYPNLALMKLSAFHKMQGDAVDWYDPMFSRPERIYASKIFNFSSEPFINPNDPEPEKGGTGYSLTKKLPEEIDGMFPDYSIYPKYDFAIGFLTRGCIRQCPWCVVPKKEGRLTIYSDIEKIRRADTKKVCLMDNNFLASPREFMEEQVSKIETLGLRVDFNQGLDARLVDEDTACLLNRIKWIRYIRFSCDTQSAITPVIKAIKTLRGVGYKGEVFCYFLAIEVQETLDRISQVLSHDRKTTPFVMPFRNLENGIISNPDLQKLARWCNIQSIRNTIPFSEYTNIKSAKERKVQSQQPTLFD